MSKLLHVSMWGGIMLLLAQGVAVGQESKPEIPLSRQAVDEHIKKRIEFLWSRVNSEGHWDRLPTPPAKSTGQARGVTALVLMGLKTAGENEDDPRFQKALAALEKYDGDRTYDRGLRATLYGMLKNAKYHKLLDAEKQFLLSSIRADGIYSYGPPTGPQETSKGGDFSNTQYGVLGVWSAADRDHEIPVKYWQLVARCYLDSICSDGGWHYHPRRASEPQAKGYGSMTAAAVANLFVIWDKMYVANDPNCRRRPPAEFLRAIDGGINWLGKNFTVERNPGIDDWRGHYTFYWFYSIERVGVASGLKYLGEHDWYKEIATAIINNRARPHLEYSRGLSDWGWELLTLAYGRAPVAINKLQFGSGWNERPRDYAGLCRYLARTYEQHFNWQIMPLSGRQDEFHDAPILAFSGRGPFTFKPEEVAKIRTYLDRGGLLYLEAVENSSTFTASARRLCQQLYPAMEVAPLPETHPAYTARANLPKSQQDLLGVSDGVRTTVIIAPREMACDWQHGRTATARAKFEIGENIVAYASDRMRLWSKEESYWPSDRGGKPDKTVTVGRLVHSGETSGHIWDPTGSAGWQRMDIISRNGGGPAIVTRKLDFSEPVDPREVPVVHLTGVGSLVIGEQARTNLKNYVKAGGRLLVDAAGPTASFANSFTKLAGELFDGPLVQPPPAELPWLASVFAEEDRVWYRHRHGLPRSLRQLELLAVAVDSTSGRSWNVLYLPYDFTYALNGAPAWDPAGLEPATAEKLALAILGISLK